MTPAATLIIVLLLLSILAIVWLGLRLNRAGPAGDAAESRRQLQEMETRLKLVPDQVQKLVAILDTTRNTFRELNDKHRPEYEAIQSHQREQINGLLNDVQRSEYQKMLKEREERRKQRPFSPPSGY